MAKKSDSESIISMFEKIGKDMKMPGVDVERIIDSNRKNLQALEDTAKTAAKGAGDLMQRQRAMLEDAVKELSDAARNYGSAKDARELISQQMEFGRRAFETAVKNAGEVAGLVQETGTDVAKILRERFQQGIEELKDEIKKRTG
jgi:phasin family protein